MLQGTGRCGCSRPYVGHAGHVTGCCMDGCRESCVCYGATDAARRPLGDSLVILHDFGGSVCRLVRAAVAWRRTHAPTSLQDWRSGPGERNPCPCPQPQPPGGCMARVPACLPCIRSRSYGMCRGPPLSPSLGPRPLGTAHGPARSRTRGVRSLLLHTSPYIMLSLFVHPSLYYRLGITSQLTAWSSFCRLGRSSADRNGLEPIHCAVANVVDLTTFLLITVQDVSGFQVSPKANDMLSSALQRTQGACWASTPAIKVYMWMVTATVSSISIQREARGAGLMVHACTCTCTCT